MEKWAKKLLSATNFIILSISVFYQNLEPLDLFVLAVKT